MTKERDMRGLDGKVIVVTGGGGGLGGATARRLCDEGAHVVVADIDMSAASAVVSDITDVGGVARACEVDTSSEASMRELIEYAVGEFGSLYGLHNNAADLSAENFGRDTDALDVPIEVWQRTIDVTLSGYLYGIKYSLPHMLVGGSGSIVNTSSDVAFTGEAWGVSYGVAKAGLLALSRHVATRWGKDGIRCNVISPGMIPTPNSRKAAAMAGIDLDAGLADCLLPRLGQPRDIAATIAMLMSEDGEFVNGQTLSVNGGGVNKMYSATMR
jgi:NAD(P)-dependent dehydrogenase (short-subunit alcohol dehydrogenase family)